MLCWKQERAIVFEGSSSFFLDLHFKRNSRVQIFAPLLLDKKLLFSLRGKINFFFLASCCYLGPHIFLASCPLQISQPPPIVRRRLKKRRGAFSQTMRPCGQPGVISLMELSVHGECLKFKLPLVRDADRNLPTQLLFSDEGRAFYSN
ncbi:hypothetical protein TNIN_212761 [Trichonephila inaurata madagascariensis]|uniref:Uncharacterized protein n=1 Tax=Trichonephila inaurata madagascariensis TaxID=2747483 RepID=A0A8X7BT00_9ARAC|nr:hypothetical protein TNIN_212761 [Trichonephila inaurata madagascariensis]